MRLPFSPSAGAAKLLLVGVLVIVGGISALLHGGKSAQPPAAAATPTAAPATPTPTPTAAGVPGDADGQSAAPTPSAGPAGQVDADAKAFLTTYLTYLYGSGVDVATVSNVSTDVREQLPQTQGMISPAERSRAWALLRTDTEPAGDGSVTVAGFVSESMGSEYAVRFTMRWLDGSWEAISVPSFGS